MDPQGEPTRDARHVCRSAAGAVQCLPATRGPNDPDGAAEGKAGGSEGRRIGRQAKVETADNLPTGTFGGKVASCANT